MPSQDFAAAQDSLLARRQLLTGEAQALQESQNISQISHKFTELPISLGLGCQVIDLWRILKGREGTRPAFRVGQLDAELLDEELLQLLKGEVGEGLKFWGVSHKPPELISDELTAAVTSKRGMGLRNLTWAARGLV